jgi:hypothetical protein
MVGSFRLSQKTRAEVRKDPFADFQGGQVVLLAAMSTLLGITALGGKVALIAAVVVAGRWWLASLVIVWLYRKRFPGDHDPLGIPEARRVLGFSQAALLLTVLYPIPFAGWISWIAFNALCVIAMTLATSDLLNEPPSKDLMVAALAYSIPPIAFLFYVTVIF